MTNAQVREAIKNATVDQVVDFGLTIGITLSKYGTYQRYKYRVVQSCLNNWETRKALEQFLAA